jgi:(S)-citramalyl-CoA lyase
MSDLTVRNCRSSLFWSALRLDSLHSVNHYGADIICIDLEDAVPPEDKLKARNELSGFLKSFSPNLDANYIVRVNEYGTEEGVLDIKMLIENPGFISFLLIPKLESVKALEDISNALNQKESTLNLLGIIETSLGLELASSLATYKSRLQGFYFGGFDLSNALGCEMEWSSLLYARSRVVHAAALGGLMVIDSPPPFVDESANQQELEDYCRRSKALGMMGMVSKHGNQINKIQTVFSPSAAEIKRAQEILKLYEVDPHKPIVYEGKLVELPMIKKLQKLI